MTKCVKRNWVLTGDNIIDNSHDDSENYKKLQKLHYKKDI